MNNNKMYQKQARKKSGKNSQTFEAKHEIINEESSSPSEIQQKQYRCSFYQTLIFLFVIAIISVVVGIQITQVQQINKEKLNAYQEKENIQEHKYVEKVPINKINGNDIYSYDVRQRIHRSQQQLFYTQGLVFANQTVLFESAGLYGQSEIHSIDIRKPDEIQVSTQNSKQIFGEGCDIIQNNVYQLTWKNDQVFFYDPLNLKYKAEKGRPAEMSEGWGITHRIKNNETQIFLSDGSNNIYWAHDNLTIFKTSKLFYNNGQRLKLLNELEYANGILYANLYLSSYIVAIDIDQEKVLRIYDLQNLRKEVINTKGFESYQYEPSNCLNGIAYYEPNNTFWITGKLWPYFWEVEF